MKNTWKSAIQKFSRVGLYGIVVAEFVLIYWFFYCGIIFFFLTASQLSTNTTKNLCIL